MTETQYDRLLSFASVHQAIRAEKFLTGAKIALLTVPTPREIDLSCGQCLLFYASDEAEVLTLLRRNQVQWSKLFSRDGAGRIYEKLKEFEG